MTRFRVNPDLERELRRNPAVMAGVHDAAVAVHAAAARRAEPHRDTGEYVRLLVVEDRGEHGSAVVAGAPYANFLEYGTCSRRLPIAPTPCPHTEPRKTGIHPQLIMTGAIGDVTR
jgi:hypothetical protein